jgi:hypothetical protein
MKRGVIMSKAIQFLEAMGSNSELARLSAKEYLATVALLDVDSRQRQALMDRDQEALNELLGGRDQMLCLIMNPEDEPMRKDDDQPAEPAEENPEQE